MKIQKLKTPKQKQGKAAKVPLAAKRGGVAKGSVSADLRQVQKEAKPRRGKPIIKFTM